MPSCPLPPNLLSPYLLPPRLLPPRLMPPYLLPPRLMPPRLMPPRRMPSHLIPPHLMLTARLLGGEVEAFGADVPLPLRSFTKTLIAGLCFDAAARGELSLDAPRPGRAWTLRDLLGHRTGLGDYGDLPAYRAVVARGDAPWSTDRFLTEVPPDAPLFAPGAGWRYSNIGYLLARRALENATGRGLAELLRDRFPGCRSLRLATTPDDFAGLPFPANGYHPAWVAHGCALATPGDAVRLLSGILARFPGMDSPHDLGGPVPGRIWTRAGYGRATGRG